MRNDLVVEKMIQTIERILGYCTGLTYDTFIDKDMVVDACVFNLSQLGELANRVTEDFAEKHHEIPWRQVYGLRNRIVHDYEGVNLKLVNTIS
jgi:uncharacterized protein with HEPN domain